MKNKFSNQYSWHRPYKMNRGVCVSCDVFNNQKPAYIFQVSRWKLKNVQKRLEMETIIWIGKMVLVGNCLVTKLCPQP